MSDRQVEQRVVIQTSPELAFEAVTRASELREWLCSGARTDVRVGGRYALHWERGYHVEGHFDELDRPRRASVTWHGTGEPAATTVQFFVAPVEDGVDLTVVHRGFGQGPEWDTSFDKSRAGWASGLENLKSTLETGVDLRIARRPFLGIVPDVLDAERAAKEGIAVERGIYLHATVEDSGARAAGLDKGDVIVAFGGDPTPGFTEFESAIAKYRAGDQVTVEVVRGQERRTVQLTLGRRPQPELPASADALADAVAEKYAQTDQELRECLEGVSELEAGRSPAEGEWSAKQVLAHLSINERDLHFLLAFMALDGWLDGGSGNPAVIPGRLAAALAVTPTLPGLLDRFLADEAETVALLRGLPPEAVEHKARLYRIAQAMSLLPFHTRDHIQQIRSAIDAARAPA